ncbi:hypothetical protein [Gordonia sp. VNK21]|uniref:hypothetical protein n=1 Tax=Gordonia sp. VNK21 TaxID=3382483 RepID=UPI0038D4B585
MTASPTQPETATEPEPPTGLPEPEYRLEFGLLVLSGLLLGVLTSFFLLLTVGPVPVPVTALGAGLGNLVLLWMAGKYTSGTWRYTPIMAWAFVTVLAMLPLFGNAPLLGDWRLLLDLIIGLGVPMTLLAVRG